MSGINIRDLIFAVCRLGSFMISVSTPEDALDHWDAREFDRTKVDYSCLRPEVEEQVKLNTYTKAGDHYYAVPLIKRDNHSVKHLIEIVPIEQESENIYLSYSVFNRIFVERNETVFNYCTVLIPKHILTMDIDKDDNGIEIFEDMCKNLTQGLLKVLSNDSKAMLDPDIYKLYLILYKVFAKKLLSGSKYITFDDSPYPNECEKLYNEFNIFDPAHKFQTPMEQNVINMESVLTSII